MEGIVIADAPTVMPVVYPDPTAVAGVPGATFLAIAPGQ